MSFEALMEGFLCTPRYNSVLEEWGGTQGLHQELLPAGLLHTLFLVFLCSCGTVLGACWSQHCRLCSQVLGVYVSFVMLRQVVTPHEAFLTLVALKAFVSCGRNKRKRWETWFNSNSSRESLPNTAVCSSFRGQSNTRAYLFGESITFHDSPKIK